MSIRAVVAIAAVLLAGAPAAGAAESPKQRLRDAATGTWTGPFGTLEFHDDGTASLRVLACGFTPVRPGFVTTYTDCEPDEVEGDVRVRTGGYSIAADDGGEYRYGAYVAGDRLFLGPGVVTRLDRDRRGTVRLGGSERLEVGDGTCVYSSAFQEDPIERRCRFVERDGRTVLLYTAPNPFEGGEVGRNGLVYLPELRLLVSPEIVERPYTRPGASTTTTAAS